MHILWNIIILIWFHEANLAFQFRNYSIAYVMLRVEAVATAAAFSPRFSELIKFPRGEIFAIAIQNRSIFIFITYLNT